LATADSIANLGHVKKLDPTPSAKPTTDAPAPDPATTEKPPREIGGPKGPEPTRYGDWEKDGRCSDF
jgi:hypothetical protein